MNNNNYIVLRSVLTIFIILICSSSITAQSGSQMVVSFRETGDSVDFSDFPDFSAIYITSDIPNLVVKSGVSPILYRTMTGPNKELIIVTPTEQKLEFEAEGYRSVIVDIPPMRPRQVVWLHVERVLSKPMLGKLTVTTRPSGADVVLSGIQKSYKTPTTIDSLVAGVYSMRISLNAYESYNQQVVINEGEVAVVNVTLQPIYGKITVLTNPSGAVFWLSGNTKLHKSPGSIDSLVPGAYSLIISMDEYESYERQVRVLAGEEQVINVTLIKKQAVVEKPTVVEPPAQPPRSQTTSQSQKDLEGSAKNDDNSITTGMVRRPSHGAAIALSVVIPGAGQIYSKRGIGWLWAIASVGSAGYSAYYYQEKASLTKAYESAYSSYISAQSVELARQYRNESEAHFAALTKAHDNMMIGLGAFAAVYVVQLLDGVIAKPKTLGVADKMSLQIDRGATISFNYRFK